MSVTNIRADEVFYYVSDYETGLNERFGSYSEANSFYKENIDGYKNLVLSKDNEVLKMEYGVVSFISEGCKVDSNYYSLTREEDDEINGCYANDALYLKSNDDYAYFYLSDDKGKISLDNVRLIPFSDEISVSSYAVKDEYLYHNIKSQMDKNYYSYSLKIDNNVLNMKEGITYYSYDGHYFYDDFYKMSDDYRNDIRDNSINSDNPYYNYYQYLPYRSNTEYSSYDFEKYLKEELGFTGRLNSYSDLNNDGANDVVNRSQLYDIGEDVIAAQSLYGANGLMLMASMINESNYGKSADSYYKNSLFYTASFDNDSSRNTGHYDSVSDSLYNYAHYTINRYLSNYRSDNYQGTYFGDKKGGLTVNYANDPYYGERNASICFEIDGKMGLKDKDKYTLAFVKKGSPVYKDKELDNKLYSSNPYRAVYPVLGYEDGIYKIQLDTADSNYEYDYLNNTGYIKEENVSFLINEKSEYQNKEYSEVLFDFDGGIFENHDSLVLNFENIYSADNLIPYKKGYDFKEYLKNYDNDNNRWVYTASYLKIKDVSFFNDFDLNVSVNEYLKINNSSYLVSYEDGSGKPVSINTDYLPYYDNKEIHEEELILTYGDIENRIVLNVNDSEKEKDNLIKEYLDNENYLELKELVTSDSHNLSWNGIRKVDSYLKEHNSRNYVMGVYDENMDISISGLDLSLDDLKTWSIIQDIYYINVSDISANDKEIINKVASAYGLNEVFGLNLSFRFNYENASLNGPVLVNVKVSDKNENRIYSVYHLRDNGDIIKVKTVHSDNYVLFEVSEAGSYLVLNKESFNLYSNEDSFENITKSDTGVDEHRVNIEFLLITAIFISNFIGIAIYFILNSRKEEKWRDYKKLLQTQGSVREEKQKN